jgi:hypothetical protein
MERVALVAIALAITLPLLMGAVEAGVRRRGKLPPGDVARAA